MDLDEHQDQDRDRHLVDAGHARRFVFQGVGSRGDVAPLIAVGRELGRRGHECHLLANAAYGSDAEAAGMRFWPITRQAEIFWEAERRNDENFYFQCLPAVADAFRALGLDGGPPARDTVVVNADRVFASNLLCERADLPTVRLYLTPASLRSAAAPCWPAGRKAAGHLGHTFRKYALPRQFDSQDRDPRRLGVINARRSAIGLPPVDDVEYVEPHVRRQVALFPDWFAAPAEDWPYGVECVGFPLARAAAPMRPAPLPAALASFLAAHLAPIVFTPGTGVTRGVDELLAHARACCDLLGRPGVFLSPSVGAEAAAAAGGAQPVLCLDYVDLGAFLDRAALLVHHGGIGTTAAALGAGVPQIIVPRYFDQPDNGRRVTRLGVGGVVERASLSGTALAAAARPLLDGDAGARASLRRRIAETDAVARCADILESVPAGQPAPERRAGASSAGARRTVLFVIWHEDGHLASPAAIARRLQARGDRVVFAAAASFARRLRALGFEHVNLSGASDWGRRWGIFNDLPNRAALGEAVDRLVETFDAIVRRVRPSAILFDSLLSPFGVMAEAAGVPWATYETNLACEFDPAVPPPGRMIVPDGSDEAARRIADAWRAELDLTLAARESARAADLPLDWSQRHFGAVVVEELERRVGRRLALDRLTLRTPVPLVPRMILAPRELDFARGRSARGAWVGACIDERRAEPAFPWDQIPRDLPIAYCAFGTQSLRNPEAPAHLRAIVEAFARRDDFFLVLACPASHRPAAGAARRMLWVDRAPQLALLRRASLAVTHAGYNSVKECAAAGVPMIAVPLSHDQPRNAALVEHLGLGVAFAPGAALTADAIDAAITRVRRSTAMRARCAEMKRAVARSASGAAACDFIDALIAGQAPGAALAGGAGASWSDTALPA
jgi:UDP:flavonoid glycosyltransferase YjiC (YdhE family)